MNRKNIIVIAMCIAGMTGCASSTYQYIQPQSYQVKTERVIPIPFNKFWDMYVAELSKSFFVINNIEKESRIINVSFGKNASSEYIDCGTAKRTSTHPSTGKKSFNYKVADSSSYEAGVKGTNFVWKINRNTTLDGRINIFMAPEDFSTLLRVNALYVWTYRASGISNLNETYLGETIKNTFSSGEEGIAEQEGIKVLCRSKGTLEKVLLNLVEATEL